MNQELQDVQAKFQISRRPRDQIARIFWIIEKAREFKKKKFLLKAFDRLDHNKL